MSRTRMALSIVTCVVVALGTLALLERTVYAHERCNPLVSYKCPDNSWTTRPATPAPVAKPRGPQPVGSYVYYKNGFWRMYLSRPAVRAVHDRTIAGPTAVASTLCGRVPVFAGRVACAAGVATYFASIKHQFTKANNAGKCVRVNVWTTGVMTFNPVPCQYR